MGPAFIEILCVKLNAFHLSKSLDTTNFFLAASAAFKIKLLCALGFFSARSFQSSKTADLIKFFEEEDYARIKEKLTVSENSYLKLLAFLDSIIESLTEKKLKTARFVNGKF